MRVLNIGSLNMDKVYSVDHFVQGGETIAAAGLENFCGGKGFNQSLALARAGATVFHAGSIGPDGAALAEELRKAGADTTHLRTVLGVSGHAVIQLTPKGQNCIIVYGGANAMLDTAFIDSALAGFGAGDVLLLQNETSNVDYAIRAGKKKGLRIALNPSPISPALLEYPLELVDIFILNEDEAEKLCAKPLQSAEDALATLKGKYPNAVFVLTMGKHGAYYHDGENTCHHGIYDIPVVDTTGAGDTFCGYFLACTGMGMGPKEALETASLASSIAVSRKGAGASIPTMGEVDVYKTSGPKLV